MSRLTGEQLFEIMGKLPDEFVTEALPLSLLGGAAGAPLYSLSAAGSGTAAKTGFGAWLAKGGWIALVAGVVVAAGVAVGAFLLGNGGDTPPVGTEDETSAEQEQSRFEEGEGESKPESETETETETETEPEIESETLAPSEFLKYVSNGDGTCYVAESNDPWPNMDIVIPPVSPDGDIVTAIGREAFRCRGITSVVIPDTVTHIGEYAFYDCWDLTSITIPDSVVSIGSKAFGNSEKVRRRKKGLYYVGNWVVDCDLYLSEVTWKEGTKGILENAFEGCYKLTSIEIPDGVVVIGDHAFSNCRYLTSVVIPDSVTELGASAFEDCISLTTITLAGDFPAIRENAFLNCSDLTSVVIPEGVTSIGENAFKNCASLTSVTVTGGLKDIEYGAFKDCSALTSMTIPDSVTHIGANAFEGCTGLAQEDGVTYVGNWIVACDESVAEVVCREGTIGIANGAFEDCFYMKTITIPTSLDFIGDSAFYAYRVKDIYYAGSEKQWRRIRIGQFNNTLSNATFHYNYVP